MVTVGELTGEILKIPGQTLADALDILRGIFNISKSRAVAFPEVQLDQDKCLDILSRLKSGEPSAYVVGSVEFYGVKILVDRNVLIPRPETEEMVSRIIESLGVSSSIKILDLCTGSGCIAIALKKALPKCEVIGSDISPEALKLAKASADLNKVSVIFKQQDLLKDETDTYDLIVSNPPYIPEGSEVDCEFEPSLALFSGPDGLDAMRGIARDLFRCLNPKGSAVFEIEPENVDVIKELLTEAGNISGRNFRVESFEDLEGKDRFVWVRIED